MGSPDFSGYATRNDLYCSDGRVIRKNAFKSDDGCTVPLIWNHDHKNQEAVLGHAILENRDDGVYAYGYFNDTEAGQHAKKLVQNGDVKALSIWANQLKQNGSDVVHGVIRELSLVLGGANPGAYVDFVMAHSVDDEDGDSVFASWDEPIDLIHSGVEGETEGDGEVTEKEKDESEKQEDSKKDKTVEEIFSTLTEEQQRAVYGVIGTLLEKKEGSEKDDKEEDNVVKHNVFDNDSAQQGSVLSHSDTVEIIDLAKQSNVGSLQLAMQIFAQDHSDSLAHGVFDSEIEKLFPEYELLKKGEPETLERDQTWIGAAMSKISKSPISRVRTRRADARIAELRANGYQKKGDYKKDMAEVKLLGRTTDPQTIYIKDGMHRDDITDITDFDVVAYQWKLMRHLLDEELAMAALVGDRRDDGDPDKIHEDHIRSIWHDDELYCIHQDVDIEAAKAKLQGSNTGANFSENYIYAEAMIESALYSREKYKGSGTPDLYCTPHLLNVMLLARDLNGRRIYDSKADLARALNVGEIYTVEQFEGLTRVDSQSNTKKLLGLFVNLSDYTFGATKGGEVSSFTDFDVNFNTYTYLLETRVSGSLTKVYSAIALEENVA